MIGPVGMPDTDRFDIVSHVIELANFYYERWGNVSGGSLHVALGDGNIERSMIAWCRDYASTEKDHLGVALAECLLELTDEEIEQVYEALGD